MSLINSRFTLLALPQQIDEDGVLTLNIVFIPRNINPLKEVNSIYTPAGQTTQRFVDARPNFEVKIVNDPDEFAGKDTLATRAVSFISPLDYSSSMEKIYKTLQDAKNEDGTFKYFDIEESRSSDQNPSSNHTAPPAELNRTNAIRKYLPNSYRKAFNFTSPRLKNAVTDDSYHCAMRDQEKPKDFIKDDKVSWGKVYGYLLRQPAMAKKGGLLYETKVQLSPGDFEKGGWIYVDVADNSDYATEQKKSLDPLNPQLNDGPFIKRYAAKIPALKNNTKRNLFSAVLFPVMREGESPIGVYDDLFIEAAQFNQGFATIVHANQPVSGNLLNEEADGFHPQKEIGMRLGWEDEQILIWYLRQMSAEQNSTERLDAPLGVVGYHIDVKYADDDDTKWESLNEVISNPNNGFDGELFLEDISIGKFEGDIPYQVYPSKIYSAKDKKEDSTNYWLPMYFANWNNSSLVIPDTTAARIYQNEHENKLKLTLSDTYVAKELNTKLKYGNRYNFRVRLADLSGGGPSAKDLSPVGMNTTSLDTSFKRFVAPHSVTLMNEANIITNQDDVNFKESSLQLARPMIGYPAALYVDGYSDPVERLQQSVQEILKEQQVSNKTAGARAFGIPDPDVVCIEIKVEVETLNLDNLMSDDGREHFITLYKTTRAFAPFDENNAHEMIDVPIRFKDIDVLNLNDKHNPYPDEDDNDFIALETGEIILPTARNIRITLRAIGKQQTNYWGLENLDNTKLDSRYGKTTVLSMRQEASNEQAIFTNTKLPKTLQGIYLQPDSYVVKVDRKMVKKLQGGNEGLPDIVHRLGNQLDVAINDMTLLAENGERIQFWCSNLIRHSLAPDNSSITFANKNELTNQWLVCTSLKINRDWTWDCLDASSFDILRRRRLGIDNTIMDNINFEFIGDLELKKTASFQAIQEGKDGLIHRDYTRIIFIDVVDVNPAGKEFPDTIDLQYQIIPKCRPLHRPALDKPFETEVLTLPTTINPTQTPKVIGAGIALSPFIRNEKYSSTEARTRYLWLEFDRKPKDLNDGLFCRVLAYSPDQLISNNHPSLMDIPEESPLSLDAEYIRVVTPASSQDDNGLNAMQEMEKSLDTDRHFYILPLPDGLHHQSAELFGMFTYEFRYGHTDRIFSTAQGRFGRSLRIAGLQHPAPSLSCMLNRDEKIISVNAPYALAVFEGKNVTASPPRTSIWALLYAQVKQADGLDYRNILLDEMQLKPLQERNRELMMQEITIHHQRKQHLEKRKGIELADLSATDVQLGMLQQVAWEKESIKQAFGTWTNKEVEEMLDLYGLPLDSSLSVLCVEVFGQITNIHEHIDDFNENRRSFFDKTAQVFDPEIAKEIARNKLGDNRGEPRQTDPLNSQLGLHRILRTSPLTEVPFICCTD